MSLSEIIFYSHAFLQISLKEGEKLKDVLFQTLANQSLQPGLAIGPEPTGGKRKFKDQLLNSLLDFLRESSDESNLSQLVMVGIS